MKSLVFTLLAWLFYVNLAFSQTTEPFKKANTIIIETGLSKEEAFQKWGQNLAQNGYSIENSNKDFLTITTGPKDTSKMNFAFVTNSAVLENGNIQVKLKWQLKSSMLAGTKETAFYDWEYATSKMNTQNVIYNGFLKAIQAFGSFPVKYSQQ